MKTVNIQFKITSQDNTVEFTTTGEYKNNRIKFVDEDNVMNYIVIKHNTIEYYKKGEIDMKYKFDLDQVTDGYYKMLNAEFDFKIVTNTLELDDNSILVQYDLYQEDDLVNQATLKLVYETKEEL